MSDSFSIALAPLDERPVNVRYPQMLGAIAGVEVVTPPTEILCRRRVPADTGALADWLRETAARTSGVVASAELVLHGGLIPSRTTNESATELLPRLAPLEAIAASGTPVYTFGLITRVSNADDAVEEPEYWQTWGMRFYRYSGLLHKRDAGTLEAGDAEALASLEAQLPPGMVADWLNRRLRNHAINLALLDAVSRNRLSFLLLTSDDTSPWGTPSREKAWLESWLRMLGPRVQDRVMMHPGADEVGSALVARLIAAHKGVTPRIYPLYALPGGEEIVAPYEDRAVRLTVEGQIRACGGVVATSPEEADILLGVLTPSRQRKEFRAEFAESERVERGEAYRDFFARLGAWQKEGRPVALGDVTYPNGADPFAIEILLGTDSSLEPTKLAAYGAWNTAGNTLGVVVAQAVCSLFINGDPAREAAQQHFLAHRFLEDWGYQAVVRREAREKNRAAWGDINPDPTNPAQVEAARQAVADGLRAPFAHLQSRGIGVGLHLPPESVNLPWQRTFEADFGLVSASS